MSKSTFPVRHKVYFVTTNSAKFSGYKSFFDENGIEIEQLNDEIFEPQSTDPKTIISSKLKQAMSKFPGKMLIVDDRSLFIPALNGFPGPSLKLAINTIGSKGLLKLMKGQKNRKMIFTTAMGFFDIKKEHYFYHNEFGKMLNKMQGHNLHGWTEILTIYAHDVKSNRSLAQYDETEWQKHIVEGGVTKELNKKVVRLLKKK